MYKLLACILVLSSITTAQAAPLTIDGYSCKNQDVLKADIESLKDLHENFETNSFVKGQILRELNYSLREQQMLNIICKSEDDGPLIVIVEDNSKEY